MSITVTASEHFERSKMWFIIFSSVFIALIVLCIVTGNIVWAALLFLLMGGYMYYILRSEETISMNIQDIGLQIGSKIYHRNELQWFVVEYHRDTQMLHNIVILHTNQVHHIYSFADMQQDISWFIQQLSTMLPFQSSFEQSFVQQVLRRIKL
jgi:hypothetical protein